MNIGVAAHITAAATKGPRYDPSLTVDARRSIENAIWLCQNCAKLIDSDVRRHSVAVLREWKVEAESRARQELEALAARLAPQVGNLRRHAPSTHELPEPYRSQIEAGGEALARGRYEDARACFEGTRALATTEGNQHARIRATANLAMILSYFYGQSQEARKLLDESLSEARGPGQEAERAAVLFQLGGVLIALGQVDEADSALREALALDERLEKPLSMAGTLVQLAWVVGHRGDSRETLELNSRALGKFMAVYQGGDPTDCDDAIQGIAACYFQQAMVHRREARVEETEAALISGVEWQRKLPANHDLAKLLHELAGLRFHQQDFEHGVECLKEAGDIYRSLALRVEEAGCLDMMASVLVTRGERVAAGSYWQAAATAAAVSAAPSAAAEYLFKLGQLSLEDGDLDRARNLLQQAEQTCAADKRGWCLAALAKIAEKQGRSEDRSALLSRATEETKRLLPAEKRLHRRGELLCDLGAYHHELGRDEEALDYFQKAKAVFEGIPHARGIARTLGVIAGLKGALGRESEERQSYMELWRLVEATPHDDLKAIAEMKLGEFDMRKGDLAEAHRRLMVAERLARKYSFPFLDEVLLLLDQIEAAVAARRAPQETLQGLVDELYHQLQACPADREACLRYWSFSRGKELAANLRTGPGPCLMVVEESVEAFLTLAAGMRPYVEWSLLAAPSAPREEIFDHITVTDQMLIYANTPALVLGGEDGKRQASSLTPEAMARAGMSHEVRDALRYSRVSRGGRLPRYFVGGSGDGGLVVMGWSVALPAQVVQLVLSNDPQRLKEKHAFFVHYNRHGAEEPLLWDLRIGHEFRVIPTYRSALPRSDRVQAVASVAVRLPVVLNDGQQSRAVTIMRSLMKLLSCTEQTAHELVEQLATDAGDLMSAGAGDALDVRVSVLEWSQDGARRLHPALVVSSVGKAT